jgi:hypothetical protein
MSSAEALAEIELRAVVAALAARFAWAGIFFVEGGELVLGPEAGRPQPDGRTHVPVSWNGRNVAELAVDGAPEGERVALERVATLVADHCLVGWDTRGEAWAP